MCYFYQIWHLAHAVGRSGGSRRGREGVGGVCNLCIFAIHAALINSAVQADNIFLYHPILKEFERRKEEALQLTN